MRPSRGRAVLFALLLAAGTLGAACGASSARPAEPTTRPFDNLLVAIESRLDPASTRGRVEVHQFRSAALDRQMSYRVYLPPRYDRDSTRRYPTLYLLHGSGGSDQQWIDLGVATTSDELIRAGQIAPLVIVMPEGEQSYWVDHANGGPKWGAYVAMDLVREVEGSYRVMNGQSHRAIGGISMGAHGALQLALNYPGVFGTVGSHSLVLRRFGSAPEFFGDRSQYEQRDPVALVRAKPELAKTLALWIDIGYLDEWASLAVAFDDELSELQVAHQWHLWPGSHTNEYWSEHLPDYLRFYDASLKRRAPSN